MRNLIKFVKPYAAYAVLIFAILMVQAFTELSLPSYTSDIVNIGIQMNGIDETIPRAVAGDTFEHILLFVPEEDAQRVRDAYEESSKTYDYDGTVYELKNISEEEKEALSETMNLPMMLVAGFDSDSDQTKQIEEQMKEGIKTQMEAQMSQMSQMPEGADATQMQQVPAGADAASMMQLPDIDRMTVYDILAFMDADMRMKFVETVQDKMSEMPESIVAQAAKMFIKGAYEEIGMDIEKIRTQYILRTGAKMLGLAAISMIAAITVGFLASKVGAGVSRKLRRDVFRKVVGFSNAEYDKFSTASLITRSTNDVQQIQMVTVMMLRMILYAPILAVGGIIKVLNTNVSMMWVLALGVVLILILVGTLFKFVMPKFKIVQEQVDGLNMISREILTGLPVIRAFGRERHEEERFEDANASLTKTHLFVNRAMNVMMPCMMLIMNGLVVLIMWVGGHGVDEGAMQVGDMMAFIQYAMQIIMSFLMLCMMSIILPRAIVSAERVNDVLKSETLIHDPENPEKLPENGKGEVEFDHVFFTYPGAAADVLLDITFTAKPGQTTAIIGSTGCGKSTLINMIPRFYDVSDGAIRIDGVDVRDMTQKDLRDKIGYVPQKGVLFSGDVASNILYGNPEGSEEEMMQAASIAQATEFIERKPKQYHHEIAQGGSNVSGGQKQRLSIARAVAKRPDIYIFDDSFSALDYKTDVALRAELKKYTGDSTVIIVAQRISTILHADQILVLEDGEIVGKGTHEELLKSCDAYYQIAASQLSEKELGKGV